MDDIQNRVVAAWNPIPEAPKKVCQLLFGIWLVGFFFQDVFIDLFSLIPTQTFHFLIWNLFTYSLFETSVLSVLFNCLTILLIGRHLEPVWGAKEFVRFIVICTVSTGLLVLSIATFLSFFNENFWTDYYCGFIGVIAAFSVALKQLNPDYEVVFWVVPVRYKYFPMVMASVSVAADVLFTRPRVAYLDEEGEGLVLRRMRASSTPLVLVGILIGWIYLRYFQLYLSTSQDGCLGDSSDSMAFHTLFPEIVQPYVKRLSGRIYPIAQPLIQRLQARFQTNGAGSTVAAADTTASRPPRTEAEDEEARKAAGLAAMQRSNKQVRDDEFDLEAEV
eukprot:TRINITY_DN23352_c0_g1_i1.p1 TRINITY_DN23352_c0_g1~~TRINITY_DN23352_c0_g1_i1.p1  ORF type:complete len:333 (-),score=29.85 TRINITY_DN23352_c0_g1_i1:54-1052(-)